MNQHPFPPNPERSIVVLPFVNMSADPDNEYFSDGITEEIINALAKLPELKVIARTSAFAFKGQNVDVRQIGKQLDVKMVLEGSVRKAGKRVRVTAQLIQVDSGFHEWSENYDRELQDIFAVQDDIARHIAEKFQLPPQETYAGEQRPKNLEAYELLLKGSYFLRRDYEGTVKALDYFKQAIEADPTYAEAYAYLGETYLHHAGFGLISTADAHAKARAAALKAIGLRQREARAHKVMAYIHLFYDWDWEAALAAYNTAVRCGLPNQNEFITYYYIFLEKDYDRAIHIARQVLQTDPLHVESHWQLGLCHYFAADFEGALAAFEQALELNPDYSEAHRWRGLVLGYLGRFAEAVTALERALSITQGEGPARQDLLIVKILMGAKEEVLPVIQAQEYVDPMDPAMLYTILHMPDEAIYWIERGYEARSVMLVTLKHFWLWDPIREDPRFQEIYRRMHFPEQVVAASPYARQGRIAADRKQQSAVADPEVKALLARLEQCMQEEARYLNPTLSLAELADALGIHPNKLSALLNDHRGKNFNEYVNTFRLEAFKRKALEPANRHLTLLALAFDSGFNSKTVFNAFFKKMEGITPRKWMKSQER